MSVEHVRKAYAERSAEYVDLFGSIDAAAQEDRDCVLTWASRIDGRIIDVGCGPGQWTSYLHENGMDVEGIDPVPEFIDSARRCHPDVPYRIGNADRLDVEGATLGGVLSWFSSIHTHPDQIDGLLSEFARCLRPDGGLVVGFFEGPDLAPFDHAVTTAYYWPMDLLAARIEAAGFSVGSTRARTDPGTRRQGTIIADRS